MTEPLTLFDQPQVTGRARRNDPHTSLEASRSSRELRLTQQDRVVWSLTNQGPATDYELSVRLDIPRHVVAKRRQEVGAVATGERRPTDTGCSAIVWMLP